MARLRDMLGDSGRWKSLQGMETGRGWCANRSLVPCVSEWPAFPLVLVTDTLQGFKRDVAGHGTHHLARRLQWRTRWHCQEGFEADKMEPHRRGHLVADDPCVLLARYHLLLMVYQ